MGLRLRLAGLLCIAWGAFASCPSSHHPVAQAEGKVKKEVVCSQATCAAFLRKLRGNTTLVEATTVEVPAELSRPLPSQLILVKVPETGSSTAASLLAEVAKRHEIPYWFVDSKDECEKLIERSRKNSSKWSLGHRSYGQWIHTNFEKRQRSVVTTVRDPRSRLASSAAKLFNGVKCSKTSRSKACAISPCEHGVATALRFWKVESHLTRFKRATDGGWAVAREIGKKFDSMWVTEQYNESLVIFALQNRLQLGDVLPPLSKYHATPSAPADDDLREKCDDVAKSSAETRLESRIRDVAIERLEADLKRFPRAEELVAIFAAHLDIVMSAGSYGNSHARKQPTRPAGSPTLHTDVCLRRCVASSLNARVRLNYQTDNKKHHR